LQQQSPATFLPQILQLRELANHLHKLHQGKLPVERRQKYL
jgi:hypothetical protein